MIERVRVGSIWYDVICVDDDRIRSNFGDVTYSNCQIRINDKLSPQAERMTLWHEVVHTILVHGGRRREAEDEGLVEVLSDGIMQVLLDNPELREMVALNGKK